MLLLLLILNFHAMFKFFKKRTPLTDKEIALELTLCAERLEVRQENYNEDYRIHTLDHLSTNYEKFLKVVKNH